MKILLIILSSFGILSAASAEGPVHLRTGVILEPSSKSVMVMLPAGGIAAVDMATGRTKWSSSSADKPLAIKNGQLLSQQKVNKKGLLALAYQSIETGDIKSTVELTMPRDVMANVINGTGTHFQIATSSASSDNQLHWSFKGKKVKGAAVESNVILKQGFNKNRPQQIIKQGMINLDFSNFQATTAELNDQHTPTKAAIEKRVLSNVAGRQFLSQNGQHVLASVRTNSNKSISYDWNVYSLNGELLSSFESPHSYAPFVIEGNLMFIIEPETGRFESGKLTKNSPLLKAISLETKSPVWQYAIRSTQYFGQLPL